MSADNGTVIIKTSGDDGPEFRVVHMQAIDNLYGNFNEVANTWAPNCQFIAEVFEKANVYSSIEEAWDAANDIEQAMEYSEYGACLVSDFEDYTFSDLVEQTKKNG